MDILEIKKLLALSAAAVAEHLLPNGRKDGQEWRAGSAAGDKGQSLGVHLTGQKAGIWSDFATNEGGDLLDLWCVARSVALGEALEQARSWLGVTRPQPYREPQQTYTRPPKPRCTAAAGRPLDYLREDRNLPASVIAAYHVAAAGNMIIFPFLLPDGTLAMAKSREALPGAAPKPTAANCEPILFGWQAVPPNAREVIITEGEIDALSWAAYGYAAMSVPFGGGKGAKQKWIESEFDRLERFEKIYISTDMDKTGDEAAEEIAGRLGRHRCFRVQLPHKDANECLVSGIHKAQMDACILAALGLDPEGLRRAADFTAEVIRLFYPEPGEHVGYGVPYGKIAEKLRFRPGEVTVWTGSSGAGKSQILSDCVVHWISEGSRVCISSLEMKPAQTLKRMVKQASNVDLPTPTYVRLTLEYLDRGLLLYDRVGKAGVGGLLEVFGYARAKYGCDQFVIDSLMRLGIAGDDYTGQEKVMFKLVDWALAHNVHVHLVAHARKGERDAGVQGTDDIKGAMEVGGNAANIVAIWRNRRHEEDMKSAKVDSVEWLELAEKPGVILNVAKQRNGDFEGRVGLWFDQGTYRYQSSFDRGTWSNRRYDIEQPSQVEELAGALF